MKSRIAALMLVLVLVATAHAAIFINQGQEYSITGYLVMRAQGPQSGNGGVVPHFMIMRVFLSASPNGEAPHGFIAGRQDLPLSNGTLADNLLTVARRFGPSVQVMVKGTGTKEGGLAVSYVGPVAPPAAR